MKAKNSVFDLLVTPPSPHQIGHLYHLLLEIHKCIRKIPQYFKLNDTQSKNGGLKSNNYKSLMCS